ncbi:hypothetical protein M422DRAFT_64701 [Sphaerobolus stellatus SS14]|nr:hypothetical protein M422DRAFT_64701 [Sphaerobolus stellatus SS14]
METVMRADTTDNEWYRMERSNVRPKIVDDIAQIATRRVRPIQTDDFGVPYANEPWGTTEIRTEVQVWVTETGDMDFKGASVLDVFLSTYSLYMVCGHGRESESEWCRKGLEMSIQGLLDASKEREPTILEERRELIIAAIEPKVEKKVKGAKRNGRKTKDIGAGYLSLHIHDLLVIWAARKPRSKPGELGSLYVFYFKLKRNVINVVVVAGEVRDN